jgi:hypothetical protein
MSFSRAGERASAFSIKRPTASQQNDLPVISPHLITSSARIPILDFRFWILDCSIIG